MKKILVIEDDVDIIDLLKIVFRDSGYDVVFSQVDPGTEYIHVLHPDLILLDVRIRGSNRNGAEICKELKSNALTENTPVILCSAEYNLPSLARSSKADMFISKPYNFLNLLTQLNRYLS